MIFIKLRFFVQKIFFLNYLYWFTSGGLICKGWSNLLSWPFLTVFLDGHCAKLAVKYLIHGIEKQLTPYFKTLLLNFHIKEIKLEFFFLQKLISLRKKRKIAEICTQMCQTGHFIPPPQQKKKKKKSRVKLQEFIFLNLILNHFFLFKISESWLN